MELNKKKININSQIKINFVKNSHIIYPISKNKYKNTNSEYLNFFNKHNSNRFISNKIINKIKLKNSLIRIIFIIKIIIIIILIIIEILIITKKFY